MTNPSTGALRDWVERLCVDPRGRPWRLPERLAACADDIEAAWTDLGYRVERQPIPELGPSYVNLIALPDDRGFDVPRTLVCAHYDTVDGTPGADDNASSVAVMIEASRLVAEESNKADIGFIAFTLEEPPFFQTAQQGSWVFAKGLKKAGAKLKGALVLEMVGVYSDRPGSQSYPLHLKFLGFPDRGDFCGVLGNGPSRKLASGVARAVKAAGLPTVTLNLPGRGRFPPMLRLSDHSSFWDHGYPAVMVTDTAFFRNPNYHGPGDRPETLDYNAMAQLAEGLADFLLAGG